jgi:hypothetical protein
MHMDAQGSVDYLAHAKHFVTSGISCFCEVDLPISMGSNLKLVLFIPSCLDEFYFTYKARVPTCLTAKR